MTIELPLTANALTDAALKQVEEESKLVEKEMLGNILPRTIRIVLDFEEVAAEIAKNHPVLKDNEKVAEIAQTLWSYPGSSGAARVRNNLFVIGLSETEASKVSQAILNYTRYPMSIVNYMRHIRSSINSIRNIFYGPKATDNLFEELGYSKSQLTEWITSSNSLQSTFIDSEVNFQNWLTEVELHLRKFLPIQGRLSRAMNGRGDVDRGESPGLFDAAVARAYARRFGKYVSAHAKFQAVEGGQTISDEFSDLLKEYEGSDEKVYKKLKTDFERRSRRLSASVQKHFEKPTRNTSIYQNNIEQSLNINGKKVFIRTSSAELPDQLINQFIKSLKLQFEMDPDQKILNSSLNVDGKYIEVEIEKPVKSDIKKIQQFVESMYIAD
jgi:hypothetical protein